MRRPTYFKSLRDFANRSAVAAAASFTQLWTDATLWQKRSDQVTVEVVNP